MALFKYLIYLGIVGIICADYEQGPVCEDSKHKVFKVPERSITVSYPTCADFLRRWPVFCNPNMPDNVREECCFSCKDIDYECKNIPVSLQHGEESLVCQDLNGNLLMYCLMDNINHYCCDTCSKPEVDIIREKCEDFPGLVFDQSCADVVDKFGCRFCRTRYGRLCCASCTPYTEEACAALPNSKIQEVVETACDDDSRWSTDVNGVTVTCDMLDQAKYKCLCNRHKNKCCETCKSVDKDTCTGDCEAWSKTVRGTTFNGDCSIFNEFPSLCKQTIFYDPDGIDDKGAGHCCETCGRLDAQGALGCVDDPFSMIDLPDGRSVACEDIETADPCECETASTRHRCCATCAKVNRNECGCKNLITPELGYLFLGEPFSTCMALIKKYPWVCTQEEFKSEEGGLCCRKCLTTDTECVNDPRGVPDPNRGTTITCSQLVQRYPSVCRFTSQEREDGFKDRCCNACEKYAGVTLCDDNPFWRKDIMSATGRMFLDRSCKSLGKKRPRWMKKYVCCDKNLDAKEECCATCKDVDCDSEDVSQDTPNGI